ncbi:MAG TPA: hypothetical protein PKA58_30220 [Polyangium sp.]|nr:hypothetical protein [Polyangium sp.]
MSAYRAANVLAALGADLAHRAGYRQASRSEVFDIATELVGRRIEQSPGVWLFDDSTTTGR